MGRGVRGSWFVVWLCALAAGPLAVPGGSVAQPLRKVAIGTSSASVPGSTMRIIKELGLYEKHGMSATVTAMDTGNVATAGLISGSFDFATSGPSDVILAQARGQDIVALTSAYRGFAATVVLSQAAATRLGVSPSAPAAERMKALDGLTIASTSAQSTYTIAVKAFAEAVGAKPKVVYMDQPAMLAAFQRGVIDGFTSSSPYILQPILAGTGVVWISGPKGDFPDADAPVNSTVVMVRRDFADANRDLMRQMTDVFADFWKLLDERPDEVKAAIARLWPNLDAKSVDLVFATDSPGFRGVPLTAAQMDHDIAFIKLGDFRIPQSEKLNAVSMVWK